MKQSNRKKIILGVVLVGTIALAGVYTASARPTGGGQCNDCGGYGDGGYGGGYGYQQKQPLDEKSIEARDKFLSETSAQRKAIATKRAEKRALMQNDNPDANKIAQLTGELFDLREQLHTKAQESGIQAAGMRGQGFGQGCNGPGGFQNRH